MIEEEKKVEETTEPKTDANTVLVDSVCDLHGNFAACGRDGIMRCAYCGNEC
jgi:hypothetical protein